MSTTNLHPLLLLIALHAIQGQGGATHTDWPYYGGTQAAWRYSGLDHTNRSNVKNLTRLDF